MKSRRLWSWLAVLVPAAVLVGVVLLGDTVVDSTDPGVATQVDDPALVAAGQQTYQAICAACHGIDLMGTNAGPPFLDAVYAPNHHGDESFQRAVASGVPQHHWGFGPMPPVSGLSRDEVAAVVAYVRSEQIAAGIVRDPSHP